MSETRMALDDAVSSQNDVRGRLKLNVPGAVMVDILPPLIDRFVTAYPDVAVELVVDDRLVDATAADCDAGIRCGEHLAQDMITVPIGPRQQQGALCAAPAYLAAHGTPLMPHDVLSHRCILTRFASGALTDWEFQRGNEIIKFDPPQHIIISTAAACTAIELAIAGHGLVYSFRNWVQPHFDSGALIPVLADWWSRFEGYTCISPAASCRRRCAPLLILSPLTAPRPCTAYMAPSSWTIRESHLIRGCSVLTPGRQPLGWR
ncbi:MAG: LysR substrate-binding domain-containing protein [Candidatus Devosia euplotis]|nr:LysR substrate-binding domain-containing protein [Candidatus Devosia euplotis]